MTSPAICYITTAIDYANGSPHMGHAFEKIGADAMARYRRLRGDAVHFVMGMDEHGLKVMQSADAAGITPQQWVDGVAAEFAAMWDRLHISHDDFIRTTEARHERAALELIRRIQAAGDFYRDRYEGWYCVGCESFKREDEQVVGEDGVRRCNVHTTRELTWSEENNWFFRLSAYAQRLRSWYDENRAFIQPESRRNEILRLLEGGLEDISVSRAVPWGIAWPGDPGQTIWVWIEALINYISAAGFPEPGYERYWPAAWHVIGKDITRFHCVIWPAMLMSADVDPPRAVWAHGFFTYAGRKLSKSEGVRVELVHAIDRFGTDAFRYYILRDVPWNDDGEFSWERFEARYNADLADDLGNLANRVLSMIERYRDGTVPAGEPTWLDAEVPGILERYTASMDANLLHQGAAAAMELAVAANGFVEARAPWSQARDPAQSADLDATLASLARALGVLSSLLSPFMPDRMAELASRLGLAHPPGLPALPPELAGHRVQRGEVLFPKEQTPA
ncbi:MAG: methionine--tRNA ligase [Gemmatimonadetes bacterium]|nr:methionine--tRNA ligase [Gemmatimonadota bacterium]